MPTFIRSIWVTGGEGRGAKVTRRWAGTTRLIYCPNVCPASRVPCPGSRVPCPLATPLRCRLHAHADADVYADGDGVVSA